MTNCKNTFLLSFALLQINALLSAQSTEWVAKATPRLNAALQVHTPDTYHLVAVVLADQADALALDRHFYDIRADQRLRVRRIIHDLKAVAQRSQPELLAALPSINGIRARTARPFWITNAIFLEANAQGIRALAQRQSVAFMDLNTLNKPESNFAPTAAPTAPGASEIGLHAINAPAMWALGYTGFGRKTLCADTGVDPSHPALQAQYWGNYAGNALAWFDNSTGAAPFDCNNHGTHVTGTMVGLQRATKDTIGVAFNAYWMGAAILCGLGTVDNIAAFQWSIDPDGDSTTTADMPDVINNSWYDPSAPDCDNIYVNVLNALEAAGIAVVFSAGNDGPNPMTITSPHNLNMGLVNIFAIGAVDGSSPALPVAGFSSRGPSVCGDTLSLLIKPEVSAPGVSVRSCVPNGGYANLSGTSMAAPHVSGALLLLKEAFPYLTGTQLKLALYFSATDLGVAGEDNTYGMGIINVKAAYDYLVAQGNVPVSPSTANDLVLNDIAPLEAIACGTAIAPVVSFSNNGTDTLFSMQMIYALSTGLSDTIQWTGSLPPFQKATFSLPNLPLPTGDYALTVRIQRPNQQQDLRFLDNELTLPFYLANDLPVSVAPASVCQSAQAALLATYPAADGVFQWFNHPNAIAPVDTGANFLTPPLQTTTTYYADFIRSKKIGRADFNGVGGYDLDWTATLLFDAHQPFQLVAVRVKANGSRSRIIELRDADGELVASKVAFIQNGERRVVLNFQVPKGEGYRLGVSQAGDLFQNSNAAPAFPYKAGEVATIRINPAAPTLYSFFYDWEITHTNICGRTPVSVLVTADTFALDFALTADTIALPAATVQCIASVADAAAYHWSFGDGATATTANPTHTYTQAGKYRIVLVAQNDTLCTAAVGKTVVVLPDVASTIALQALQQQVNLYPNPTDDAVEIRFQFDQYWQVALEVTDVLGRIVHAAPLGIVKDGTHRLSLAHLPNALYFVRIQANHTAFTKPVLKH